jgi:hypothetical protein
LRVRTKEQPSKRNAWPVKRLSCVEKSHQRGLNRHFVVLLVDFQKQHEPHFRVRFVERRSLGRSAKQKREKTIAQKPARMSLAASVEHVCFVVQILAVKI